MVAMLGALVSVPMTTSIVVAMAGPVTATAGCALLQAAGFVRDYQAMTLYSAVR